VNTDVTLAEIQAASDRIRTIAHRTPVFTSRTFDALAAAQVYFKCENFQRGGAFKIRGAANFIYSIPKDQLSRGVVTYSSGNHAQAVAIAAASVSIQATIVMPASAMNRFAINLLLLSVTAPAASCDRGRTSILRQIPHT